MCARFTRMMPWADVTQLLGVRASVHAKPSWNVGPAHQVAIIEDAAAGGHLTSAR
jgi:hypothetical protein